MHATTTEQHHKRTVATARYRELLDRGASPYTVGRFIKSCIEDRIWRTHAEVAEGLRISRAQVTRAVAIASLSMEILGAFTSPADIGYAHISKISSLRRQLGSDVLEGNASRQPAKGSRRTPEEAMAALAGAELSSAATITIVPSIRGKYLKVYCDKWDELVRDLPSLQLQLQSYIDFKRRIEQIERVPRRAPRDSEEGPVSQEGRR